MDVIKGLIQTLSEHKSTEQLTESSLLEQDCHLDYIDMAELAMELEEEYCILIEDAVLEDFTTLGQLVRYVGGLIGPQLPLGI